MANEIVYFDSTETNAPVLNNVAGSLDAVLYACLVSGFNSVTLTGVTVTSEVATATLSGHGFADQRMVQIAGANGGYTALNGRKLVTRTGAGTFTFPAPGVADGTATGTITAKRSPLGWARPASSGNVSIYERTDVTATTMALRVDDSGSGAASAIAARIRMLETWSDINTFTNPAPNAATYSGGGFWVPKGPNTTGAKAWCVIGDSKRFYLLTDAPDYAAANYGGSFYGSAFFGDLVSDRPGDAYHCAIAGSTDGGNSPDSYALSGGALGAVSFPYIWIDRAHHGVGGCVTAYPVSEVGGRSGVSGSVYPNPAGNGIRLRPAVPVAEVYAALAYPIRGVMPGLAHVLQQVPASALNLQVHTSVTGSDRHWLTVGCRTSNSSLGCAAFDITGPW